jgi:biotin carboxyl carrier protein
VAISLRPGVPALGEAVRRPGRGVLALGVLVAWIVLGLSLRGRQTLALAPAQLTPLHESINRFSENLGASRNTNPVFLYGFNEIRAVIDWFVTAIQSLISQPSGSRPVPELGWLGVVAVAYAGTRLGDLRTGVLAGLALADVEPDNAAVAEALLVCATEMHSAVEIDRLADALAETEVAGVTTNLPFLRWLVRHPAVRAGETTTAFLADHPPLSPYPRAPHGPWRGAFRLNLPAPPPHSPPDVSAAGHDHGPGAEASALTAPMPGTVIKVLAEPGARVQPRELLVVLEAMKMETPLVSPYEAVVKAVHVGEGDLVAGGQLLVELEE